MRNLLLLRRRLKAHSSLIAAAPIPANPVRAKPGKGPDEAAAKDRTVVSMNNRKAAFPAEAD